MYDIKVLSINEFFLTLLPKKGLGNTVYKSFTKFFSILTILKDTTSRFTHKDSDLFHVIQVVNG